MTDRELLEMAAKAAGLNIKSQSNTPQEYANRPTLGHF